MKYNVVSFSYHFSITIYVEFESELVFQLCSS